MRFDKLQEEHDERQDPFRDEDIWEDVTEEQDPDDEDEDGDIFDLDELVEY